MTERVYTAVDKSDWPQGPWQDEPDKIQYVDETGLDCLIRRAYSGHLCGYVGVPPGHPYYQKDYVEIDVEVHGGPTYSAFCMEGDEATSICHVPEEGREDKVWWVGFDCAHGGDLSPSTEYPDNIKDMFVYRDIDYVREQCHKLALQLIEKGTF